MKIFLAGTAAFRDIVEKKPPIFLLESFYYVKDWQIPMIKSARDFLCDSGAFTFMQNAGNKVNWNDYAKKYADFINKYDIKKYIELDLDYIIGCDKAYELRQYLEQRTGKKSIPVWHPIRGVDNFYQMCEDYDYVALGGIVGKRWQGLEQYMPWFINEAHKRGAKIHGLGFTKTSKFNEIRFDSVDSTTWTMGGRMGNLCYFNGSGMRQYYPSLHGQKPKDINKINEYNYSQWLLFQKWAAVNL